LPAKSLAAVVGELLTGEPPTLARGLIVSQEFIGAATAREDEDSLRRVDMTFQFIIEDTAE
ncbi:MAG: hypothetical protein ACPGGK_16645, partial [Pikeienuella sp.]